MGILLTLLGIGKHILGLALNLIDAILAWAEKHPLPAAAIAIDIVLLAGCAWGYHEHKKLAVETGKVVKLSGDLKASQGVVVTLSGRLRQYSDALAQSQKQLSDTIAENNRAIDSLKKAGEAQLAAAQREADKSKRERDAMSALLLEQKAQPIDRSGTADQRIAREQKKNSDFIRAFRNAR